MARDDEEHDDDWENPDESDMDDSADGDVEPCPYCKKPIHEQAEWCHHCGKYISREDAPPGKRFWWLLGIIAFLVLAGLIWNFR